MAKAIKKGAPKSKPDSQAGTHQSMSRQFDDGNFLNWKQQPEKDDLGTPSECQSVNLSDEDDAEDEAFVRVQRIKNIKADLRNLSMFDTGEDKMKGEWVVSGKNKKGLMKKGTLNTVFQDLNSKNVINNFEEIGLNEPFPIEGVKPPPIPKGFSDMNELLYEKSKYQEEQPPNIVFVPNKIVMRKLMKIACEVTNEVELSQFF